MTEPVDGNRLTLLRSGTEYFPALEEAIEAARYEIHLQTYIYAEDPTGRRISAALQRAARRGVGVFVIVDGYGSKPYLGELDREMIANGVNVLMFRPEVSRLDIGRHRLRRMHRKVVVIDAAVGFVGGINIIDDMHTPRQTPPRYDYAVRIEGPLVAAITGHARHLWSVLCWSNLEASLDVPMSARPDAATKGFQRASFLVRDNFRHRSDIEDAYLAAIESANEEILIANAYFLPGRRFRRALVTAAARGVRVVLLLQGRVEYRLLHYASRALYGMFLDGGVQIQEYHRSFLHAKVAVVDGRWATVGSSNIDPFSLLLAREANLVAEDRRFAQELRDSLLVAIRDGAQPVAPQRWRRRPLRERVLIWLAYGFARFVMGMVGYGERQASRRW